MAQARRWWPGLVIVALLWLIAIWSKTSSVEQDVGGRALAAIKGAALDKPAIEPAGRDVAVKATAFSEEARRAAAEKADATYGVRLVSSEMALVPESKPYTWSATREAGKLTLAGGAPLPDIRAKILDAAKSAAAGGEVVDQMSYARGAAPRFDAATALALAQVDKLSTGKVSITDGKLSISGVARDRTSRDAITVALRTLPEGFTLADNSVQAPPPYVFSAAKDAGALTLSGSVPDEATRQALVNVAKQGSPSDKIVDNLKITGGAPANFAQAATALVAQAGRLSQGAATLSDADAGRTLAISGVAKDGASRDAIAAALRILPAGFSLGENAVKAPAYVFNAVKDSAAGTLTFSGAVPDDATRQAVLDAAKRTSFTDKIIDNLNIVAGAPANFAQAATALAGQMGRLSSGVGTLSDENVDIKGEALYERAAEQIKAALAGAMPGGFKVTPQVATATAVEVDAPACQQLFSGLLAQGSIRFETGKAVIDQDSGSILDRLVAVAQRCPKSTIEISGHTDSSGSDETNRELSRRRAQAVVDHLVAAGVGASGLEAAGYGSAKPIASNDTDEGKAKNRRIEFAVK